MTPGAEQLDLPLEECSELEARRLEASADLSGDQRWWAEWGARIDCWWLHTPMRESLGACVGSLGLLLARRFERAFRGASSSSASGTEPACDWIQRGSDILELPDFPAMDTPEHGGQWRFRTLPAASELWRQLLPPELLSLIHI